MRSQATDQETGTAMFKLTNVVVAAAAIAAVVTVLTGNSAPLDAGPLATTLEACTSVRGLISTA